LAGLCVARDRADARERRARRPVEPKITAEERAHWAFQKPVRPTWPAVRDSGWVRTPVDAFILARLEKAGLRPAPPADRVTLLRRITFDLTGLPPTPAEVDAFIHDTRPHAYERVVDRLLGSPHYGERWAQHWLDVVRYAETDGYEADGLRPHAWRYRDYVIHALNTDKPYDQFITEQLAGDELAGSGEPRANAQRLIATGFNRCGQVHIVGGNTDPDVNRQEVLTEMTGAVGSAFLGLTLACARCHDHKFDPISQADYYRIEAFFAAAQPANIDLATETEEEAYEHQVAALQAKAEPLRKKVKALEEPYEKLLTDLKRAFLEPKYQKAIDTPPKQRTPEQNRLAVEATNLIKVSWDELREALTPAERAKRAAWREQIHAIEERMPPPPAHAWAIHDADTVPPTHVLKRGNPKQPGPVVEPAIPRLFTPSAHQAGGKEAGRLTRLDLARWLTRPDHPLTARVLVNRLWQHHFGRGLVATPNDFGVRGERPSHPQLLDWLATEFVARGWSIKHMHRLVLLSNTYRQASRVPPTAPGRRVDPDNRLLWRMNRQRLEGEALRDSALAVSGRLNLEIGGPMVRVPLEPAVMELIFTEGEPDNVWNVTPDAREHVRRSIYLFAKRNVRLPIFEAFDRPDSLSSCPVRPVSTFAPQAFILLNGPFMQAQSKAFATRLLRECGTDRDRLLRWAYRLALARPPRPAEMQMAREFVGRQADLLRARLREGRPVGVPPGIPPGADGADAAALADFCLALLNRNEFVYIN
jgi:hypothetical protein